MPDGLEQVGMGVLAIYAIRTIADFMPKFRNGGNGSSSPLLGTRAEDMYMELIRNQNAMLVAQQQVISRIDSLIVEVRELVKRPTIGV